MCDAKGSCWRCISSTAAFTSRMASPSAARAFCRRFRRICSVEHASRPRVKPPFRCIRAVLVAPLHSSVRLRFDGDDPSFRGFEELGTFSGRHEVGLVLQFPHDLVNLAYPRLPQSGEMKLVRVVPTV